MIPAISQELREKRAQAGRIGGLQTFLTYGSKEMRARGRLGGRPKSPTLATVNSQSAERGKEIERSTVSPRASLRTLLALYSENRNRGVSLVS
jgi:hypothetical protein